MQLMYLGQEVQALCSRSKCSTY